MYIPHAIGSRAAHHDAVYVIKCFLDLIIIHTISSYVNLLYVINLNLHRLMDTIASFQTFKP